jgi:hypothetical protein
MHFLLIFFRLDRRRRWWRRVAERLGG